MTDASDGHWRWHADTTWHYHVSMVYAMNMARAPANVFSRYYHTRCCLYFATCAAESYLNTLMRNHMQSQHTAECEIYKMLRHTTFSEKRKKWPEEVCKKPISFGLLENALDIRYEITHPKRADHSIYSDMDDINLDKLVDDLSLFIASAHEALGEPFPYWLLGWNYVSMQRGSIEVVQSNNMNGFYWSMRRMGFVNEVSQDIHWADRHMRNAVSYTALKRVLGAYHDGIEPSWPTTPHKERLTRRWWDHDFIIAAWNRG